MTFRYFTTYILFLVSVSALSQAPPIAWQRCLNTSSYYQGNGVTSTTDGGIAVASQKSVRGSSDPHSVIIARYDVQHTTLWQTILGGSQEDIASDLIQTTDGGFLIVGHTESNDGQVNGNHGGSDLWLIKVSTIGTLEWQKCLGGSGFDTGYKIAIAPDGDYVLTGATESNDGDVSGNHGGRDVWMVKVSATGSVRWQRCFGGSKDEEGSAIISTADAGFVLSGYTISNDQQVSRNHGGGDLWVVKVSDQGELQWQRCLGGSKAESGLHQQTGLAETPDGYAVATNTLSSDGDVSGYHGDRSRGIHGDGWLVWLDRAGLLIRQRCLGGTESERFASLVATPNGGLVAVGFTNSIDGDAQRLKPFSENNTDYWYVRISATGDLLWQKAVGGTTLDLAHQVIRSSTGEYIAVGSTSGPDGDVGPDIACFDGAVWIVALGPDPVCQSSADLSLSAYVSTLHPALDGTVTVTVSIHNSGPQRAENIQLMNRLPANLDFISSSDFSQTPDGLSGQITALNATATQQLRFTARPTAPGLYLSAVQISQTSGCDPDSRLNSGTGDGEDDMAVVNFRTVEPGSNIYVSPNPNQIPLPPVSSNQPIPDPAKADLSLRLALESQTPMVDRLTSLSLIVTNQGGLATSSITMRLTLPADVEVVGNGQSSMGSYVVQVPGSLTTGQSTTLPVTIRATRTGAFVVAVEITAADVSDSDSTVNNGTTNGEDDTARVMLRVR